MLLQNLIEGLAVIVYGDSAGIEITGIVYDSREIKPGNIFVCFPGLRTDGKLFITDAVSRGAKCIISGEKIDLPAGNVLLVTGNLQELLADISVKFYDYPSLKTNLIGVTGTNGKTTITYLLEAVYKNNNLPNSVIGTINYRINNKIISNAKNTTPYSSDLQYLINKSVESKVHTVIMEVSSHGLVLNRLRGCEFDAAIFTNLTRDHLDFHKTMDEYFNAKLKLFQMLKESNRKNNKKIAVINLDDNYGKQIVNYLKSSGIEVITYSIKDKKATFYATDIKPNTTKTRFTINNNGNNGVLIKTHLLGKHNIYNILAAYACAVKQGLSAQLVKDAIESVANIPGRLEKVPGNQPYTVLVDYAHTDDALTNVLTTLNEIKSHLDGVPKIITVFGCGGDRDRLKRPIMGSIAVKLSDYAIVTSDNPRSEGPHKILLDIEVGIQKTGNTNYEVIADREQAIKRAIQIANKNDIILIAGKGHEYYQIIGNTKIHFSDIEISRKYINTKNGTAKNQ